ncbi:MAG TPA: hypothetical protein VMV84_07465 [Dehalococcoidales bacterium]|nr:hypothetical protein [Dehalococcoidales bacterium]
MSDWGAGYVIGMAIGLGAGIVIGYAGRKQKPWSELTKKEKRLRGGIIITLAILVVATAVVLFLVS